MDKNDIDIGYALLATQRALLGEVTQNLRAVVIDLQIKNKSGRICFYYDGEISEVDFDIASCAITEITAAFPIGYSFEERIERLDAPAKIPVQGRLAYLRKEV
ncbi:MAG: hypothetical protein S4CHLAM45_06590 [Chlamydiales bacterium]|nr:hypothetical protein [Chlamydiales bacterium]MCH9620318.1 hypothetical protein [Chlamydiales bacterium]MCH9622771.1 hypothetical protein [Chlamydiales bacterium]